MSNAALAAYRKARATEMALAGCDYDTIATELGYANRGTAWRTVQRALRERADKAVDAYRLEQVGLLNDVLRSNWDDAMAGDVRAAQVVLRTVDRRIRLLGLAG